MRYVDTKKREDEILDLVVNGYIRESRPISSSYLCEKFKLPLSSATVRHVLESLEKKGYLSHLHTSSGRVPTQAGFRHYVKQLNRSERLADITHDMFHIDTLGDTQDIFIQALEILSTVSGYTSLMSIWGNECTSFFRGVRFILEQPEFEDIIKLKNILYTLEVKLDQLEEILFNSIDSDVSIFIGDDIGCEEMAECSLLVSGIREQKASVAFALLGPMRMNYERATASLNSTRECLTELIALNSLL